MRGLCLQELANVHFKCESMSCKHLLMSLILLSWMHFPCASKQHWEYGKDPLIHAHLSWRCVLASSFPPPPPFFKSSLKAWENYCCFLAGDFERPVPADSQRAGGLMQNSIKECCARGFQCLRVTMTSAVIFIYIIKQLELMEPVKE